MNSRNPIDAQRLREQAIERYVLAHDRGDFSTMREVVEKALHDPELDHMLIEVDAGLYAETSLPEIDESAETVKFLLRQHLPSGFIPEPDEPDQITIGDVAQSIEGDRLKGKLLYSDDVQLNKRLFENKRSLPVKITPDTILELAKRLGLEASAKYWELFRRAALALRMSRENQRVSLAAARRQRRSHPSKRKLSSGTKEEKD